MCRPCIGIRSGRRRPTHKKPLSVRPPPLQSIACTSTASKRYVLSVDMRTRRVLMQIKDVPLSLRARRAFLLYKVYGDSALLVLNGTSLNSVNTLLALSWQYTIGSKNYLLVMKDLHCIMYRSAALCTEAQEMRASCIFDWQGTQTRATHLLLLGNAKPQIRSLVYVYTT